MRMVRLTKADDGSPVWINPEHVVAVYPLASSNNTNVIAVVGGTTTVSEKVKRVVALIEGETPAKGAAS